MNDAMNKLLSEEMVYECPKILDIHYDKTLNNIAY